MFTLGRSPDSYIVIRIESSAFFRDLLSSYFTNFAIDLKFKTFNCVIKAKLKEHS